MGPTRVISSLPTWTKVLPCESVMEDGLAFASKSNPTMMRSPAAVLDGKETENVATALAEFAAVCTNEIFAPAAERVSGAETLAPRVAVMVALWLPLKAPAVAVNVAEVAVAPTVTDPGTLRIPLLLERLTLAPPAGAAWESVTVQELDVLGPKLVGLHASEETTTAASRLTVALLELLL